MSMWSLRWHFTNKSVTGAPYSIKGYSYSLSHSRTVKSTMTETVPSWGRGGTAAIMAQNEQTTEQRYTLEQQWPRKLDHPAWCVVWSVWPACVQETRWRGSGCRFFGAIGKRYKLFWIGSKAKTDGVGIFLAEKWVDSVVSVERYSERVRSWRWS